MRGAWEQLTKRKRDSSRAYYHPAKLDWGSDDVMRQAIAIGSLLYLAVNLAVTKNRVMTQCKLRAARNESEDNAEKLRHVAQLSSIPEALLEALLKDAQEQLAMASKLGKLISSSSKLLVERDTGDAQARCFAILFSDKCKRLFGMPLYGVTATTASVALQREVTPRAVREWVSATNGLCR